MDHHDSGTTQSSKELTRQDSPTKTEKNERAGKRPRRETPAAPLYGAQDYWENRYRRQFQAVVASNSLNEPTERARSDDDATNHSNTNDDTATLAYHAWYFTYEDLRPLLWPLLVGGRRDLHGLIQQQEEEEEAEDDDHEDEKEESGAPAYVEKTATTGTNPGRNDVMSKEGSDKEEQGDDDEDDSDGWVEEAEEGEDGETSEDEDSVGRDGLAQNGPITILEIGCGDVPLGAGFALELKELEETTEAPAQQVVQKIVCTDYSPTVIETMQRQYRNFQGKPNIPQGSGDIGNIPLEFAIADARQLTYSDRSFELVVEKGTLDAMLSDKASGVKNCIKIVSECARVLTLQGCLVLVSHLNAHTDAGVGWLSDVVFEGLRQGDPSADWVVECHGNEEIRDDLEIGPPNSAGPAVYVIKKRERDDTSLETSTGVAIPVKFFSY